MIRWYNVNNNIQIWVTLRSELSQILSVETLSKKPTRSGRPLKISSRNPPNRTPSPTPILLAKVPLCPQRYPQSQHHHLKYRSTDHKSESYVFLFYLIQPIPLLVFTQWSLTFFVSIRYACMVALNCQNTFSTNAKNAHKKKTGPKFFFFFMTDQCYRGNV